MQELRIVMHHRGAGIIMRNFAPAAVLIAVASGFAFGASGRPAITASSIHSRPYQPAYAVDGNAKTRWASNGSAGKPQWLEIDFGKVVCINPPEHGANEHRGHVAIVTDRFGPDERSAMRNISGRGYGASFDLAKDPVNVYELDRRYWESLWYYPPGAKSPKLYDNSKSERRSSDSE